MLKQPCDEGVIRGRAVAAPCARSAEPWVLAATILGSSMVFIDGTVVNVALPAYDSERFANRRAELYWNLRERFRTGDIALPRDEILLSELTGIRYSHSSTGKIKMESKEEMKKRGGRSPDRADMLALLFDSSCDWVGAWKPGSEAVVVEMPPSPAERLRREMRVW